MSASPAAGSPTVDPPTHPPKTTTERVATVLAWLVPPLVVLAAVIALVPVRNGRAQDCGTPLAFVVTGRTDDPLPDVDRAGQPDEPPENFTDEEYRRAAENPCRSRAGTRMAWTAGLAAAAFVIGLIALVCLVVGRYWVEPSTTDADPADEPS